MNIPI
jgi:hypothetical protein